jgi:hypothetical protein
MAPIMPPQLRHKPMLRLHIDDLSHSAAQVASNSLDGGLYLTRAIEHVIAHLYTAHGSSDIPRVRSITVVLRPMGGVAYTTGLTLDELHKEIHLSLDYVQGVLSRNSAGVRHVSFPQNLCRVNKHISLYLSIPIYSFETNNKNRSLLASSLMKWFTAFKAIAKGLHQAD